MFNTINKSKIINTNVKRTPFCKVCIDAGLPNSVYESHWVKTLEGKVCCPTLLEQSCRYCKVKGHTVKFCNILKQEQESNKTTSHVNKTPIIIATSQVEQTQNNAFSSLYESDTDDDEKPKQKPKQFKKVDIIPSPTPVIISKSPQPPSHTKTYASVVTTTPEPIKQIETLQSHCISLKYDENHNTVFTNIKIIKNWADYSDSDSD